MCLRPISSAKVGRMSNLCRKCKARPVVHGVWCTPCADGIMAKALRPRDKYGRRKKTAFEGARHRGKEKT